MARSQGKESRLGQLVNIIKVISLRVRCMVKVCLFITMIALGAKTLVMKDNSFSILGRVKVNLQRRMEQLLREYFKIINQLVKLKLILQVAITMKVKSSKAS